MSKICFDISLGVLLLLVLFVPCIIIAFAIFVSDFESPIFVQDRVGRHGSIFKIYKFRTMKVTTDTNSVTITNDHRVTKLGKKLRLSKLDELPQLLNILKGEMSFIGPRPDVSGFADKLENEDRIILTVKPGISGPAQLYFRNEEELLAKQDDPIKYNNEVIWREKVEINKNYVNNWSFSKDVYYLIKTIF